MSRKSGQELVSSVICTVYVDLPKNSSLYIQGSYVLMKENPFVNKDILLLLYMVLMCVFTFRSTLVHGCRHFEVLCFCDVWRDFMTWLNCHIMLLPGRMHFKCKQTSCLYFCGKISIWQAFLETTLFVILFGWLLCEQYWFRK